jgi:hypothetical protein
MEIVCYSVQAGNTGYEGGFGTHYLENDLSLFDDSTADMIPEMPLTEI